MTEGTSMSGAPAAGEAAAPLAPTAPAAAAPVPVDAHLAAMAAEAMAAAPAAPAVKAEAPAVGPAAAALAAIEAAAALEAAAAAKAEKAEKAEKDSDETSMSDAEVLPEVELASLGEAAAATAGQPSLPCGVLPVVDAPVAVAPVEVPVADAGFGLSPALLGLLGLGALGLGFLLLRNNDDDDDDGVDVDDNAAPVAADETVAVNEDATVTGQLDATDADGDTLTYTAGTAVTGLTVNSNGTYTFDASSYDALGAGETQVLTTTFTVTDGNGGSDTGNITVTVTGVNDAPVAGDDTAAATEDGAVVNGNVSTNDTDADGDTLTYALQAPVAGLTLNANGTYTFDPSNAAYQDLGPGETEVVTATVLVSDGNGGSDTSTLTITVTGQSEPPVLTVDAAVDVDEGAAVGTVVVDADATDPEGDDITFSLTGTDAGLFAIDAATGVVTVAGDIDFEATDGALNITVVATDENGGTDSQAVVVTVNDILEPPVITSAATVTVEENIEAGAEVYDANAVDPEGEAVTFSLSGADAAAFTIDANTGEVFIVASPDFEANADYNITVTATDADGMTDDLDVVINVSDVGEAVASLDVDNDANVLTPFTIDAGTDDFLFQDDDDVANNVVLVNFGANDVIAFEAGVTAVAYTAEDTGDGDGLNDLLISINNGGVVSEIRIEDVADDNVLVLDEATAELAVAGTNTFQAGAVFKEMPIDTFA